MDTLHASRLTLDTRSEAPPVSPLEFHALRAVLEKTGTLPQEALFLGLAEDGLPVLLNLLDPVPGPVLIGGDASSGKSSLLQMVAAAVELRRGAFKVQFCVLTPEPEAWQRLSGARTCAGILDGSGPQAAEFLDSLFHWAHDRKGNHSAVILLLDGLEQVPGFDAAAGQNLRWLFLRGPSRGVWPLVTLDTSRLGPMNEWLSFFRTRIFSRIEDPRSLEAITAGGEAPPANRLSGRQFAMRERQDWLIFNTVPLE